MIQPQNPLLYKSFQICLNEILWKLWFIYCMFSVFPRTNKIVIFSNNSWFKRKEKKNGLHELTYKDEWYVWSVIIVSCSYVETTEYWSVIFNWLFSCRSVGVPAAANMHYLWLLQSLAHCCSVRCADNVSETVFICCEWFVPCVWFVRDTGPQLWLCLEVQWI